MVTFNQPLNNSPHTFKYCQEKYKTLFLLFFFTFQRTNFTYENGIFWCFTPPPREKWRKIPQKTQVKNTLEVNEAYHGL